MKKLTIAFSVAMAAACVMVGAVGMTALKYRNQAIEAEASFNQLKVLTQKLADNKTPQYAQHFQKSYERSSEMNKEWMATANFFVDAAGELIEMLEIQTVAMHRSNAGLTAEEDKRFSVLRTLAAEKTDRASESRKRISKMMDEQMKADALFDSSK